MYGMPTTIRAHKAYTETLDQTLTFQICGNEVRVLYFIIK